MRSEHEANLAIEKYCDMVKRICFLHLKNEFDTEDIFQNVFIKYKAYQELLKYYPDITPEECNELSMNEIKNLILESGGEWVGNSQNNSQCTNSTDETKGQNSENSGNGKGNGNKSGNQKGKNQKKKRITD